MKRRKTRSAIRRSTAMPSLIPTILGIGLLLASVCAPATPANAQSLVSNAISWFPPDTTALEFSNLSELRAIPDYGNLRARFLGRNLRTLESSLSSLGIQESDLDSMALGWKSVSKRQAQYEGIVLGSFDPSTLAQKAAASGISSQTFGGLKIYCLRNDPNSTCISVLDSTLGLFGPLPILQEMIGAREGKSAGMASDQQLSKLVRSAQSPDPIWGAALGLAVGQWFQTWLPTQKNFRMDWATAFKDVKSLTYHVQTSSQAQLSVVLNCTSTQSASSVSQLLEGLKLVQQLAWRASNPSTPDPFQDIDVQTSGQKVLFHLTTDYSALEHTGPLGQP